MVKVREHAAWAKELRLQGDVIKAPHQIEPEALFHSQAVMTYKRLLQEVEGVGEKGSSDSPVF